MGLVKGGFLRFVASFLYFLGLLCSVYIMAATAWFVVRYRNEYDDNNDVIAGGLDVGFLGLGGGFNDYWPAHNRGYAIIGMALAATVYSFFAMLLTCCLAGVTFFAILAVLFDFIFFAVMIVIAILNRSARHGCGFYERANTDPFGAGIYGVGAGLLNNGSVCRIYVGTFALAIVGIFVFLVAGVVSAALMRGDRETVRERVIEVRRSPWRRAKTSHDLERTPSHRSV